MGFLPIILVLVCAVILWGIVSSNSIKTKRQEAEASAFLVFKQFSIRNEQLRPFKGLSPNVDTFLAKTPTLPDRTTPFQDILLAAQRLDIDLPFPSVPGEDSTEAMQQAYQQLQVAQENLLKAMRAFNIRLSHYNELVNRQPTKMMAWLMGYSPVSS